MRHGLFGPRLPFGQNMTAEIAIAKPYKACTPLTNAADVRGRIVVVLRGECYCVQKRSMRKCRCCGRARRQQYSNQWSSPQPMATTFRIQIPVLKVLRRANATIQAPPTGSSATLVGDCSAHCPASGIGDDICDEHCRTDVCAHDNGDCAPDSFECNFDRGMCGWENVGTGQETADSKDYWRLDVGMTSTHSTGPLADHIKGPGGTVLSIGSLPALTCGREAPLP